MPDTNKHDPPLRIPRRREPVCPQTSDASALARLLDEWMLGDETEQREPFDEAEGEAVGRVADQRS